MASKISVPPQLVALLLMMLTVRWLEKQTRNRIVLLTPGIDLIEDVVPEDNVGYCARGLLESKERKMRN